MPFRFVACPNLLLLCFVLLSFWVDRIRVDEIRFRFEKMIKKNHRLNLAKRTKIWTQSIGIYLRCVTANGFYRWFRGVSTIIMARMSINWLRILSSFEQIITSLMQVILRDFCHYNMGCPFASANKKKHDQQQQIRHRMICTHFRTKSVYFQLKAWLSTTPNINHRLLTLIHISFSCNRKHTKC